MYKNWAHSIYHITGKYNTKENGDTSYYSSCLYGLQNYEKKSELGISDIKKKDMSIVKKYKI